MSKKHCKFCGNWHRGGDDDMKTPFSTNMDDICPYDLDGKAPFDVDTRLAELLGVKPKRKKKCQHKNVWNKK